MVIALTVAQFATAADCGQWNTEGFFGSARVGDVRACLDAGAGTDARDRDGNTPLHEAAENENPAVIQALLDAGADASARDGSKKTPWDYAAENSALRGTDVYWRLHEARFE